MPNTTKRNAALILAVAASYLLTSSKYNHHSHRRRRGHNNSHSHHHHSHHHHHHHHHHRNRNVISKRKKPRRYWVKERNQMPENNRIEAIEPYYRKLKMVESDFNLLLQYVEKDITKKNTKMRMAYSAKDRLEVTLRFLASGESYRRLDQVTCLSLPFLSSNIPSICEAIYENLKEKYLKFPTEIKEWLEISNSFRNRYDFPHCLGVIYEKKFLFRSFRNDDTTGCAQIYIAVIAVTNADHKFIYVEFDLIGGQNAAPNEMWSFFERSQLKQILENSNNTFPKNAKISAANMDYDCKDNNAPADDDDDEDRIDNIEKLPYMFIGGRNLPLHERLLVPYKTEATIATTPAATATTDYLKAIKIFNQHLYDVKNVAEKSIEMLLQHFKILKTLSIKKEQMQSILLACFALHNFLMTESYEYEDSIYNLNFDECNNGEHSSNLNMNTLDEMLRDDETKPNRKIEDTRNKYAKYFLKQSEKRKS